MSTLTHYIRAHYYYPFSTPPFYVKYARAFFVKYIFYYFLTPRGFRHEYYIYILRMYFGADQYIAT